ncbi:MAG: hypothetical protein WBK76_01710 [Candidatus Saccharimonadales bacterium]
MTKTNHLQKTYDEFSPERIQMSGGLGVLIAAHQKTNLSMSGEIHGIQENAHVLYALCHELSIGQLGIECHPTIEPFIQSALAGDPNFSLVNPDLFKASVLSIETLKTVAMLFREGIVKQITCIDTFTTQSQGIDETDLSPQEREEDLAHSILSLDLTMSTLCIMGQWHTEPKPVSRPVLKNGEVVIDEQNLHHSALYRVRQKLAESTFIHNVYREGHSYNAGRAITLDNRLELPSEYTVRKISDVDFEVIVPEAHRITGSE